MSLTIVIGNGTSSIAGSNPEFFDVGETWIYTADYVVTQDDINLVNVASVNTDQTDPLEDDATTTISHDALLTIDKVADKASVSQAGEVITYTYRVTNLGYILLTGISVTDDKLGEIPIGISFLLLGLSTEGTATYTVTQDDIDAGVDIVNVATVTTFQGSSNNDRAVVSISQSPSITIEKMADKGSVSQAGEIITYTFKLTNTGNTTLTSISVEDDKLGAIALADEILPPGAFTEGTASYAVTQADMNAGSVENTATASGTAPDNSTVSANDTETITATQAVGIQIIKSSTTVPNTYTQAGDVLTYNLVVTNTGSVTLTNIVVSDPKAAVTGSPVASLLPAASVTLTASYTVTQADVDAGQFTNTATATGSYGGAQSVSDDDSETVTATQAAGIQIVKSSTTVPNTYTQAGDVLTYDLVVTNTGSVTLTNIVVTDPKAAVTGSPVASLLPAASVTLTASYTIIQADVDAGQFTNTATATSSYGGAQSVSDDDSETVTATQAAGIQIVKSSTTVPNTYTQAGDVLTYDLVVTNTGSVTLTNIVVTDPKAAVTGSPVASLLPAASVTLTASYTIIQADVDAGQFTNTATATSSYGGAQSVSDDDSETVTATQAASVLIEKAADKTTVSQPGEVITYTYTVTNNGKVTLTGIQITDNKLGNISLSSNSLAPTETASGTATYIVSQSDINLGLNIENEATAKTSQGVTDSDDASVAISQSSGLEVTKTASPNSFSLLGEVITFTIDVENTGNVTITGIAVTDPLTGLNTAIATLAPGGKQTFTQNYQITQTNLNSGSVTNTATATGKDPDNATVSSSDTETVTAVRQPGLTVTKSASPSTYTLAGEQITFTINVENTGNVTITGIAVTDPLTGLNTAIATLAPGAKQSFTQNYQITQTNLNSGSVTNTATATGKDPNNATVSSSDSETVTAVRQPKLTVTKSASPSTYSLAGEVITFTINVENTGNVTITGIAVTDPLTGLNTAIATLAPGGKQTFTQNYQITQTNLNSGSVTNTATATGKDPDNATVSSSDTETVTAVRQPGLTVTKSASPSTYTLAGEQITFTINVENTGNVTITGIAVTDPLTGLNTAIATLAPGGKQTFTQNYQITQTNLNSGSVTNTATATGKDPDNVTVSSSDTETVTAVRQPGLTVTKSASPSTYTLAGEQITFTIDVENTGNVTITGIAVTDPLTGLNTTIASLAPGGKQTFTQTYQITQTNLNSGSVTNTATATGKDPDNVSVSSSDTETVTAVRQPKLTVTKSASPSTYTLAGEQITFTIDVENTGNVTITDIAVTDPLTGLNTTIASLAPGAKQTFTQTYQITQTNLNSGSVTNTATATGKDPDNVTVSSSDTETVTAVRQPGLTVTKSASPSTYTLAGEQITFTIDVENTGNVTITGIAVTDPLTGLNTAIASLAPGAKQTFTQTYQITQTNLNSGSVTNTATATGKDPDNVTVSSSDTETVTAVRQPKLTVTKSASPSTYTLAGEVITFTINVENTGNVTITGIAVTDPLTGLNTAIASLAPGGKQTFTQNYQITQTNLNSGSVTNTATATGKDPNNATVSSSDSETVTAVRQPGLTVTKSASPSTYILAGEVITFTINVENTGNVTITGIAVTDPLTGLNTAIATLAPGAKQTFTQTYQITQANLNSGSVANTATATGKDPNNATVSSSDTETVTAVRQPKLTVTKSASPSTYSLAGEVITFTINVENTGNVTITGIAVTDPLTGLNTAIATLAPGGKQNFTQNYQITQTNLNSGSVTNTATATGKDPNNATVSSSDSETVTAVRQPKLTVTKSASPSTYTLAGEQITFTIDVENTGNVTITGIAVTDPLTGLNTAIATLAPGAKQTFTQTYQITQTNLNSGSVTNTATATGKDPENVTVSSSDTETVTAVRQPGLTVTKSASPSTFTLAGEQITFTIDVENTGNVTITGIAVTDPLTGLNTAIATLAPGAKQTFTQTYQITQTNLNSGSVTNTATATGKDPENVTVSSSDSETVTAVRQPKLTVTKSASPSTYTLAGEVITFTINVENTGNVTITGIAVTDPLTGLNTAIATLAPGGKQTFTQTYQITQTNLNSGSVTNTATATGKDPDNATVSSSDSETVTAVRQPGLTVTKSASPSTYTLAGEQITFTIDVENTGNVTITDIAVTDPLTGLNTTIASLAPGGKQTFTQTYQITQTNLNSGSVTNTATATGKDPDNVSVSSSDTETVTAVRQPGLTVTKSASPSTYTLAGEQITFTIDVENTGNVTITDIAVTDPLTGLNTTIASLAPGAKQTFTQTYQITQTNLNSGSVTNTATATGKDPDNVTVSSSDTETVTAVRQPGLTVTKSASPSTYTLAGEQITFTIDVENTGNVTITGIAVTDPLTGLNTAIASLAPGGKQTFTQTYQITQTNLNSGSVTNTATATGKDPENVTVSSIDSETILANLQPELSVTKNASPGNYNSPGEEITYTIVVKNSGNVIITDIVLIDPLLALNEVIASIAQGVSVTYTKAYTITQDDLDNGVLINTASASGKTLNNETVENMGTSTIFAEQNPDLNLTITTTPASFATIGSEIIYTITLKNTGNVTITDIALTDPLLELNEFIAIHKPGTTVTYTKTYAITQTDYNNKSVTNIVTAKGKDPNGKAVEAEVTKTVVALGPPVAIDDENSDNKAGDVVTFDILENDRLQNGFAAKPELVTVDLNSIIAGIQTEFLVNGEGYWSYNILSGEVTFDPQAGFTVDASPITYILTENLTGRSDNATINVEYNNGEPFAINDISSGHKPGNIVNISILANDRLSDNTQALINLVTVDFNPTLPGIQHELIVAGVGSWVYNPETGIITFTPEPGFTTDPVPFRYLLTENLTGLSDEGRVTIGYIEEPPTASDDINIDNNPGISATLNILANDKLSDGTPATSGKVKVDIDPEMEGIQTELIVEGEGVWSYNPETGTITFTPKTGSTKSPTPIIYTLTEDLTGLYDEGTITVTYKEIPPVASDDSRTGNKPGTAASVNILDNDRLSDNSPALQGSVTIDLNPELQGVQAELVVPEQGTWRYNRLTGLVIFTPLAGFTSDPTPITYSLTENVTGLSDNAIITIDYTEEPPAALNDSSHDNIPGSSVSINILENDLISDGSSALNELVTIDLDPLVDGIQVNKEVQDEGVWTVNVETGLLSFTPMPAYFSNPSPINYRLCSKISPELCDEASVFVYYDLTLITTSVGLVKKGVYNSSNGTINYTFEVTNTGQFTIGSLTITDERIGVTNLNVVPDTLGPGRKGTASASYIISQEDIDVGRVTNTARVSGRNLKGEPVADVSGNNVNNDEPTVTLIDQNPSVFIQKEAVLFADNVVLLEEVSFNILVTNNGNVTLYDVLVEDPLTGFEQETTQLPPGGSLNFTTRYIVQISDATEGQFDNEAFVTAKTFNGSTLEASSSVIVQVEGCELVIPTGFSPNDDGIQDKWRIKCLEGYPDARVEIFNRWGNRVFEKENFGNSDVHGESDAWWDGYSSQKGVFGNDRLPNGTYYYVLYLNDGIKPLNGYLFLNK